ncbi:hypothetical protein Lwal_1051 [Legionella waltersii]|uniref:Uncharacterized protein n=2 Tax=Legionella waltersii TaxID=66969 RepID=A0A0W1AJD7_9GAMM|nr:hypothetical protein Lwal_1051 [Legionella waltersii]SNV02773.1 Uncharacterised protein [Legionella waltersii]
MGQLDNKLFNLEKYGALFNQILKAKEEIILSGKDTTNPEINTAKAMYIAPLENFLGIMNACLEMENFNNWWVLLILDF